MAFFRRFAIRAGPFCTGSTAGGLPLRSSVSFRSVPAFSAARRGFSSSLDPYKTLGVNRDADEAEIKKAYREKALKWHPDKNPEDKREEAQKHFADAANAYEILKDPETRREFDVTGRVGGGPQGPGGGGGMPRNQADAERLFREAFGQQGMEQIMRQLLQQQQMGQQQQQHPFGSNGPPRRPGFLQADMEVRIRRDEATIHSASRRSNIDTDNDERRARYAGKLGTISKTDPRDQSIKIRVMVSPRQADEVWFGAGAVWDPLGLDADMEVQICPEVASIHEASREAGIDTEHDERRARCAGKSGRVVSADQDGSVKVRVLVKAGRADEVWFGIGAVEPLPRQDVQHQSPGSGPSAYDMGGSSQYRSAP